MAISQNTALFSLLGTLYGGDGRVTFGLPNLREAVALGQGVGPGLAPYYPGEEGGTPYVTLSVNEMASHNHGLQVARRQARERQPAGQMFAEGSGIAFYNTVQTPQSMFDPRAIQTSGGSQPHNNMQPYLVLHYCIALTGIFPQRPLQEGGAPAPMMVAEPGAELQLVPSGEQLGKSEAVPAPVFGPDEDAPPLQEAPPED
jgi:microcystin-dependent protein